MDTRNDFEKFGDRFKSLFGRKGEEKSRGDQAQDLREDIGLLALQNQKLVLEGENIKLQGVNRAHKKAINASSGITGFWNGLGWLKGPLKLAAIAGIAYAAVEGPNKIQEVQADRSDDVENPILGTNGFRFVDIDNLSPDDTVSVFGRPMSTEEAYSDPPNKDGFYDPNDSTAIALWSDTTADGAEVIKIATAEGKSIAQHNDWSDRTKRNASDVYLHFFRNPIHQEMGINTEHNKRVLSRFEGAAYELTGMPTNEVVYRVANKDLEPLVDHNLLQSDEMLPKEQSSELMKKHGYKLN